MTNIALLHSMVSAYDRHAFTHNYIFGFVDRKNVYMVKADHSVLPYVVKLDQASRGAGFSIRFKPDKSQKELLKSFGFELLCSEAYLKELVANSIYNEGEIFEKLVTEKYGQVWTKDHVPFTDDGDLTVDGTVWQIKYNKATFASEKQLAKLG